MRALLFLSLIACRGKGLDSAADSPPLYEGPFSYSSTGQDGRLLIDTLWIVSEQAVDEIAAEGQTPEEFLDWRIDDMNATLQRSLIDSSVVRSLGVHVLVDDDYERSGASIGDTSTNISYALKWLGTFREAYGADKVMIVAGTEEGESFAALGGGDVSAHWVTFLPVEHEFGHQMGADHCNKGDAGALNYGYPSGGYSQFGAAQDGPIAGGTRMCGNTMAFFSNPDVRLTIDEIDALVDEGLLPDGDWESMLHSDGTVPMGHAEYADMASHWRSEEAGAAEAIPVTKYDGEAGAAYDVNDCVGLFTDEGYGGIRQEVCAGERLDGLADISAIQLGEGVHVNLYTASDFGAESTCGGQLVRLAFSSPSLSTLSSHHGIPSLDDAVTGVAVYTPDDRAAHRFSRAPYTFYGDSTHPICSGSDGEAMLLMPDNRDWSATAALYSTPVPVPFAVDFTVTSDHDDSDGNPPADAMTFFFAKSGTAYEDAAISRDQLGVATDGTGYAVELNVWTDTVSLRDADWNVIGDALSVDTFTDGEPVDVRIAVHADEVVVTWAGEELLREAVSIDTTHEHVGFSAATGAYTIEYLLEDIRYSAL